MQLRSGKNTYHNQATTKRQVITVRVSTGDRETTKREKLVKELREKLDACYKIPSDDFINRSEAIYTIFQILQANLELIKSGGLTKDEKFIPTIIKKSQEIMADYEAAQEAYFDKVRQRGLSHLYLLKMVHKGMTE
jgi:hypothetical protein